MSRNREIRDAVRPEPSQLMDIHRLLPQAGDAEEGILASILLSPEEIMSLCDSKGVTPEWFHIPSNGITFYAMQEMWRGGLPIEPIALSNKMRDDDSLKDVGGVSFIMQLATFLPTAANAAYYIEIVREKRILREGIRLCMSASGRCYDDQGNVDEILNELDAGVSQLLSIGLRRELECKTETAMLEVEDRIDESTLDIIEGVPTGIPTWHDAMGVIRPSRYIALGARPAVGKTALMEQMAMKMVQAGYRVAIFQKDMPIGDMMARIACREADLVFEDFDQGRYPNPLVERIREKMKAIDKKKLRIYAPEVFCGRTIKAALREENANGGIDIAFVDVFQKLRDTDNRNNGNMAEDLATQSNELRKITVDTGIPIIVLAHMNRDADVTKRPHSGQFKGCDQLFSDVDTAVLMWSGEDPKTLVSQTGVHTRQEVRLVIDKNRGGYVGEEIIYFDRPHMRFHETRIG